MWRRTAEALTASALGVHSSVVGGSVTGSPHHQQGAASAQMAG